MDIGSMTLLPFLIPLGVVLVFTLLQVSLMALGGISLGLDMDVDVDVDIDHDVDLDVDMDVDHDIDMDHDVDHDADLDGHGPGLAHVILSPLGVGRVPMTVIWQAFFLAWGLSGIGLTYVLHALTGANATWFLAVTLPVSLVPAWLITSLIARMVAPLFKTSGKAESVMTLIGKHGTVTSLQVDAEFGEAVLKVNNGPNHVVVRTRGETICKGSEVVVVDVDVSAQRPVVALMSPTPTSQGV